ncbi:hypothetical protein E1301_Tti023165 [Triplophysa tibetana]|uniref:Uncharacterized protein n=1 Tax=Triplophysa tibetana TaxID=1572043 RepID=A0A5A9NG98_9TELE|nr:hypothetical protein E1301_Tti023165 [Triplophysa tibetana]
MELHHGRQPGAPRAHNATSGESRYFAFEAFKPHTQTFPCDILRCVISVLLKSTIHRVCQRHEENAVPLAVRCAIAVRGPPRLYGGGKLQNKDQRKK